jgi:hypothetical protein
MTPANVPFSEADLVSHALQMCPHQWQDQYNLQEKGMTPMDMSSLQASLETIERACTPEKSPAPFGEKASHKNKAGAKQPSNGATKQAHGSQECLFWEVLQAVQEKWVCTYYARYQRLPQVLERRDGKSRFLCHQEGR